MREAAGNVFRVARLTAAGMFRAVWVFVGAAILSFLIGLFPAYHSQGYKLYELLGITALFSFLLYVILFAYYVASEVRTEIDSKKVQPMLGLPITRDEYLVGKWLGVVVPAIVLLTVCALGLCTMAWADTAPAGREDFFQGFLVLYLGGMPLVIAFLSGVFFVALFMHPILNILVHAAAYVVLVPVCIGLSPTNDWYFTKWIALLFPHAPWWSTDAPPFSGDLTSIPWHFLERVAIHDFAWVFAALFLSLVVFRNMNVAKPQ